MSINQIYFAQHGLAIDKTEDPERSLSAEGISQTEAVAHQLKVASIPVSCIFHSGKRRAQQTAEIFASTLSTPASTAIHGMSPMDSCEILKNNLNTNHALYVGHLPHLEKFVTLLVTRKEAPNILQFKNSSLVCLGHNNETFAVQWHITPELLPSNN